MEQMNVDELKQILVKNDPNYLIIDVRTNEERAEKNIGGLHIPLNLLPQELDKIDKSKKIVIYCKSGGRSTKACEFLEQNGASTVYNLAGGITEYLKTEGL